MLAQEFKLVGREVDHQKLAASRAARFGNRSGRIVEEVQHLVQDDGIGGAVGSGTL